MAKTKRTKSVATTPTAAVQPVPMGPEASALEEQAREVVRRQRGEGPVCRRCGSGMVCDRSAVETRAIPNHPLRPARVKYWKCLKPECGGRERTVEQA